MANLEISGNASCSLGAKFLYVLQSPGGMYMLHRTSRAILDQLRGTDCHGHTALLFELFKFRKLFIPPNSFNVISPIWVI